MARFLFALTLSLCLALPALGQQTQAVNNGLANASSRYLRDAASQVVWRPWGQAAFDMAKRTNRPIFLSIGYASSWEAHRLNREAFGNPTIAESLNGYYIPVLVDRFEHPEVAAVFDRIQIGMSGAATIPSSFVLTPALEPYASIASTDLRVFLATNASRWANERDAAIAEGRTNLGKARLVQVPEVPDLAAGLRSEDKDTRAIALDTLRKLAKDPRRDPVGGGFHRSATELEKLLIDQAMIAGAALDAWQITRDPIFEDMVRTTLDYVVRDLHLDKGAFDAAQDAYSLIPGEGPETHNGVFYATPEPVAQRLKRPQPFRDFTEIAGWNGLMVSVLARAGAVFGETRYRDVASIAAQGLVTRLWNPKTKTLLRQPSVPGLPEDYVYFAQGMLDVFDATYDVKWLDLARTIQASVPTKSGASLPESLRYLLPENRAVGALSYANQVRLAMPKVVVVTGDFRKKATHELLLSVHQPFDPSRIVVFLPDKGPARLRVTTALPFIAALKADPEQPVAYVCESGECRRQ